MQYKLIHPINPSYTAIQQVLTNRGIKFEDIPHYLHTTDADINSPAGFGLERLKAAASALIRCVKADNSALIIVD